MTDTENKFPFTNSRGTPYREEIRDGHVIRVYSNGSEYDYTIKRLIKPPTIPGITAANAVQMQAASRVARRENKLAAAVRGAVDGAFRGSKDGDYTEYDVIEAVIREQVQLALDREARGTVQAAKLVFDMLEVSPDRRPADLSAGVPVSAVGDLVGRLFSLAFDRLESVHDNGTNHDLTGGDVVQVEPLPDPGDDLPAPGVQGGEDG